MAIKTTSLETSKLLKEAGFRQDTFFRHYLHKFEDTAVNTIPDPIFYPSEYWEEYPSPTTDEILEELIGERQVKITWMSRYEHWLVSFRLDVDEFKGFENKSLPEALASLWLWLKKENLI